MLPTILVLACASAPPVAPAPAPAPSAAPAPAEGAAVPGDAPRGSIGGEPILDRPVVLGGIATEAIEAGIASRRAAIDACYAPAPGSPAPAGKVLVKFTIGADGAVTEAHVRSTSLRHRPTEDCVVAELSKARFPALRSGAKALVQYPLDFGPP